MSLPRPITEKAIESAKKPFPIYCQLLDGSRKVCPLSVIMIASARKNRNGFRVYDPIDKMMKTQKIPAPIKKDHWFKCPKCHYTVGNRSIYIDHYCTHHMSKIHYSDVNSPNLSTTSTCSSGSSG